eukprot:CAMPEP_0194747792 /NCGR_PEP_ID=MMETSP0323_2-20130528/1962_1 /TAXON_ID=2866 ORGANISM="Crypthecodinium cohnii, Strain Seligo" /NCGR_SAMPLE_ID=MMETSP0323_2 /ASSEMBLY_ACC=CAM_ASM_000346 /LENGTH=39 /DNA_ID= /DNA_START= /DNA_END= /DNA_ORIENTATION=
MGDQRSWWSSLLIVFMPSKASDQKDPEAKSHEHDEQRQR